MNRRQAYGWAGLILALNTVVVGVWALTGSFSNTIWQIPTMKADSYYIGAATDVTSAIKTTEASYTVWNVSSTYYALNGITGETTNNANAATIISACLSGLTAGRTWKEKVVLKGDFPLTTSITIPAFTTFDMRGAEFTVQAGYTPTWVFLVNSNSEILGGIIDGDDKTRTGIRLDTTAVTNLLIDRTEIKNLYTSGANDCEGIMLQYPGSNQITINGVYIHNITHPSDPTPLAYGITVEELEGIYITNSRIELSTATSYNGISIFSDGTPHSINDRIIGNTISGCGYYGIQLYNYADNCIISDNHIIDCDGAGIYLTFSEKNTISSNYIEGGQIGVLINSASNYNNIIGNTCYAQTGRGIMLQNLNKYTLVKDSPSIHNLIQGNVIIDVANSGYGAAIEVDGSSENQIIGNDITDSSAVAGVGTGIGIYIYPDTTPADLCTVSSNKISNMRRDGIRIEGNNTLLQNNISKNNDHESWGCSGIAVYSFYNDIEGNQVLDTQGGSATQNYGIEERGSADQNIIVNNFLSGNTHGQVVILGYHTKLHSNIGFDTENSGLATILNGTTSIAIPHGLSYTPAKQDITASYAENPTNDAGSLYWDTIGGTTFTVHCLRDPGSSNLDIVWSIRRLP